MFGLLQTVDRRKLKPIQKLVYAVRTINFMIKTVEKSENLVELTKLALLKTSKNRSEEEFLSVEKLMGKFKFFQDLQLKQGIPIFKEFCKELYLRVSDLGEKVIKKGYYGQTFFVILDGTVGVAIYNPKNLEAKKQILHQQQSLNRGKNAVPDYDNPKLFDSMEIASLESGYTFGDLALLQNDSITSATVITKRQCQFACMDRRSFWKYLGKDKQQELDLKLTFLKVIPFLQDWQEQELKTLSFEFKNKSFFKRQIICHQNKPKLGLYIIISGEVSLTKSIPQLITSSVKKNPDINLPVSMLGAYQYFGDGPSQFYEHTVTCESKVAEFYFVSKVELENRLQWNQQSKSIYESLSTKHSIFHQQREDLMKQKLVPQNTFMENDGQYIEIKDLKQCLSLPSYVPINTPKKYAKPYERVSRQSNKKTHIDFLSVVSVLNQSQLQDGDFKVQNIHEFQQNEQQGPANFTILNFRERQRQEKKLKQQFEQSLEKMKERYFQSTLKNKLQTKSQVLTQSPRQVHTQSTRQVLTQSPQILTQSPWQAPEKKSPEIEIVADKQTTTKFASPKNLKESHKLSSLFKTQPQVSDQYCIQSSKLFKIVIKRKQQSQRFDQPTREEQHPFLKDLQFFSERADIHEKFNQFTQTLTPIKQQLFLQKDFLPTQLQKFRTHTLQPSESLKIQGNSFAKDQSLSKTPCK